MTHIRTKIRNAFVSKLRDEFGHEHAHSAARSVRGFQKDNFPIILVAVSERLTPEPKGVPGSRTTQRDVSVMLKIAERSIFDDVEERLDTLCGRIEGLLADPESLDLGGMWNYKISSSGEPDAADFGDDLVGIFMQMTVDFTIKTTDSNPSTNLY